MTVKEYPARNKGVIWRDIAGEVVIVGEDDNTVRMLNKTASVIWSLADGSRHLQEIVDAICNKFEVPPQEAGADVEEFCSELVDAGLLSLSQFPQES